MMSTTRRTRRTAAILAVAAIAPTAAVGVSVAGAQSDAGSTTSTKTDRGPRHGGPDLAKLAAKLGVTEAQLKAAIDATRPAAGAKPGDHRDALATDLAAALGVSTDKVQSILDANRPARPAAGTKPAAGTRPPKPDSSALVSALSSGLSIDTATVQAAFDKLQAAHEADHSAREAAMAAALAKQLNLDAVTVQKALASLRPAGRG